METSQNNWKASKDPNEIDIKQFLVAGTNIKLRCNAACGLILAAFAGEFHKLVEPINVGTYDDWGYAYRPVRGKSTGLSNHASGTAIDLNSTKHVLGKDGTFTKDQVNTIHLLIAKYHLRAGIDYKTRKDAMHFEIVETPKQVKALTQALKLSDTLSHAK